MLVPHAVRARGVTRTFDDVIALDAVDLDVPYGQIHGLIGPNGAGKTTLLALLLGLARVDSGQLEILGRPIEQGRAAPGGIAGFIDGPGLYPSLTARRNLAALARLRGDDLTPADIDGALDQVGLADVAGDRVRGFSLGMRQRLGIAAALLTRPKLLVLDEPANGLDPAGAELVHSVLTGLAHQGTAIVLSSHRMSDVEAMCEEVTILAVGRVVFAGPQSKLLAEDRQLDYRLITSDHVAAGELVRELPAVTVVEPDRTGGPAAGGPSLVIRAATADLDELVTRIIGAGIRLRELAPVVSPLEAAFRQLTDSPADSVPDNTSDKASDKASDSDRIGATA